MGSINPVFVLPGALAERGPQIAEGLKASVTLGVGQFCTNPGLVVALAGDATARFEEHFARAIATAAPGTMLYPGVRDAFQSIAMHRETTAGVRVAARGAGEPSGTQVSAVLFATDARTFLADRALSDELFGPSSLLVTGDSRAELEAIARDLDGHLTATVHGTPDDLREYRDLISILELKVGRLVFNGYPTGIEPCPAVHHGGPYPATTDPKWTSIGTAAADRFVRPICYQDFPRSALPDELRDENPRNIWRLIDGAMTKDAV
jgi:NADP-dependent aldehyde dehydrogenase